MYETDPQTVNEAMRETWPRPGRAGLEAPPLRGDKNELLRPLERHLSLKITVPHTEHPSASHQCNTQKVHARARFTKEK